MFHAQNLFSPQAPNDNRGITLDRSSPPLPFSTADHHEYFTVRRRLNTQYHEDYNLYYDIPFHVLRHFARSSADKIPVIIPWEAWSQSVYVDDTRKTGVSHHGLNSGRVLKFDCGSLESDFEPRISLLDLNRYRANRRPTTTRNPTYMKRLRSAKRLDISGMMNPTRSLQRRNIFMMKPDIVAMSMLTQELCPEGTYIGF